MSTEPTTRLLLFGGAALEGDRGPITGRGAQRRRLALLALLAVNRRGQSRDKLIGYLWEESDTDKARRLLSESLFQLRKSLGEDAILSVGDELRLNPAVIWSDVEAFAEAMQGGDDARAVTLYTGPLLDGFFISEATEFSQWVDRERGRLGREYAAALTKLAQRAEERKDFQNAVQCWRKLCVHDPYGTVPALGLMRALDAVGNRVDALQYARTHASRLHDDLGAEPDGQVEAFARELRAAQPLAAPERIVAPVVEPVRITNDVRRVDDVTPSPPAPVPQPPPKKRWRVTLILVLLAIAVTALVIKAWTGPSATNGTRLTMAIIPSIAPASKPDLAGEVAQLLSTSLNGAGDLRTVDPHRLLPRLSDERGAVHPDRGARLASRFGAQMFVLLDVIEGGSQYTITAHLYNSTRPDSLQGSPKEMGTLDDLNPMVDRLSRQLAVLVGHPADRLRSVAAMTTDSYPTYKLYLQGDKDLMAGRYAQAVDSFTRAIKLDPGFALAYYRLSAAQEWNFKFKEALASAIRAGELSNRLPQQQRLLIAPWKAFLQGQYQSALNNYGEILASDRDDVEAMAGLAEVLVHYNPVRGLSADSALPFFKRVLEELPEFGEARFHALEFAVRARDRVRFDSILARFTEPYEQSLAWEAVSAFTWGTPAQQSQVLAKLSSANAQVIGLAAGRVAAHTHNFAAAGSIVRPLTESSGRDWRAVGYLMRAQFALAANNWDAAQLDLQRADTLERDWTRQLSALYLLHPFVAASHDRIISEIKSLEAWNPELTQPSGIYFFGVHALVRPELRLYLLGLLSAAVQDTVKAEFYRIQLTSTPRGEVREKDVDQFARSLAQSLRGHIAMAKGQDSLALAALTSSAADVVAPLEYLTLSPFYARAHDRFTIARLYEKKPDQREDAARWYRSFLDSFDFVYAAAAEQALSRLYEQADTARAARHRKNFEQMTHRWR